VVATPGVFFNVAPQTPISFRGPTPAATIAQKIAGLLGATFENNGVNTVLTNPYYSSDAISMIQRLSEHVGFEWILDKGTLAIVVPGQSRQTAAVAISPQTVQAGYPMFVSNMLIVKCLFNPDFAMLGNVQVQSSLTPASGMWRISKLEHDLEALTPHGKWYSTLSCIPVSSLTPAT
jgi:hypothetical protein